MRVNTRRNNLRNLLDADTACGEQVVSRDIKAYHPINLAKRPLTLWWYRRDLISNRPIRIRVRLDAAAATQNGRFLGDRYLHQYDEREKL